MIVQKVELEIQAQNLEIEKELIGVQSKPEENQIATTSDVLTQQI